MPSLKSARVRRSAVDDSTVAVALMSNSTVSNVPLPLGTPADDAAIERFSWPGAMTFCSSDHSFGSSIPRL
ncbi:MAG: hypothetical protein QF701_18420, partial [Nitrospinota bacterium]|nr:hypothetical protein [Nitrospinota bacterium]